MRGRSFSIWGMQPSTVFQYYTGAGGGWGEFSDCKYLGYGTSPLLGGRGFLPLWGRPNHYNPSYSLTISPQFAVYCSLHFNGQLFSKISLFPIICQPSTLVRCSLHSIFNILILLCVQLLTACLCCGAKWKLATLLLTLTHVKCNVSLDNSPLYVFIQLKLAIINHSIFDLLLYHCFPVILIHYFTIVFQLQEIIKAIYCKMR